MKTTHIVLFALALQACVVDPRFGDRDEGDARRVCVDQAEQTGHRVAGVRSSDREGRENYRVMLRVQGVGSPLVCDYDGRSRTAQLHWE